MVLFYGCTAAPVYEGPPSSHFDGRVFANSVPAEKGPFDIARLSFGYLLNKQPWPKWVDSTPRTIPLPARGQSISVTFINHSTVLLQVGRLNILTDPIYAERASPFTALGPRRVRAPGVSFDALPEIDVVLVSHNHYDHLDLETLQRLQTKGRNGAPPRLLSGLGNGSLFATNGIGNYRDLDWGESEIIDEFEFIFTEGRHRSGRGISDQMNTLWGSFVIKSPSGNIYFAGDSGYGPHFKQARREYGDFDLALLPIGAYEPRWFMAAVHLDPPEAVRAHIDLGSAQSVAIHFGTFQLTYEGIDTPVRDLRTALDQAGVLGDSFWVLGFGETRTVDHDHKIALAPDHPADL
jgi:L-ascorbate metabolism protein UlaG (beta-lactamase superfamily)